MTERDPLRLPDPRMLPPTQPKSWFEPVDTGSAPSTPLDPSVESDGVLIRPFMVTGGRTRPLHDGLKLETMVFAQPAALSAPLQFEQRRAIELAQEPITVAELASALDLPIGVARVLIADLYTGNYLSLREPTQLETQTIERIRDLVRAL
ncbi:MAG TPA: DUF742 domain-containing protein [Pseudonocardiaceae bacterium]|nr:DUF742 domain-containing protein [Pseudonocardiaceae bacterium]